MTDAATTKRSAGRAGAQPARHLEAFRRRLGADRHRSRRACGRGGGARRRQRRRQVDAGQDPRRRAPAELGHDHLPTARPSRSPTPAPRSTSASPPSSRIWRCARTSTSSPTSSSAGSSVPCGLDEVAMEMRVLDAAQRAVGAHPERARRRRVAVGRPAPDRRDRPLAAARAEAHHARRADRRPRRRADRRGAQPDRAGARRAASASS